VTWSGATEVPRRRLRARPRSWALGAIALLSVVLSAWLSVGPLLSGGANSRQLRGIDLTMRQVVDLRAALADWQTFDEPQIARLSSAATSIDPLVLARGVQLQQAVTDEAGVAVAMLERTGLSESAREVAASRVAFTESLSTLAVLFSGRPPAELAAGIAEERAAYAHARAVTSQVLSQLREKSDVASREGVAHRDRARATVLAVDLAASILVVSGALVMGQRSQRRERAERALARRRGFETTLHQALEMSKTEADAYEIMTEALRESVPTLEVQMLVADSSRAHFRETLSTAPADGDGAVGCGVVSPLDCPATIRGHTLVYPTSRAMDACPQLKHRPSGECSAVCVAINITGQTMGVVHATGRDGVAPADVDIRYLEITSRSVSERLALLRAFEKSESQARSDPLTGLWNRRSLENRVNDLQREGVSYAVAYGDLDNFKLLNDTFGHEGGDQALRTFARVLRDSIRPDDVAARYGGEEFVIVLPDCTLDTATSVLERLREKLALSLTSGRVPSFTVSFGVASSEDADTFDGVVAVADRALLTAKANGRNRTVRADEPTPLIDTQRVG
jgi:diguanylate cyclase (GGDEF)-like protein